jgi:hypothetical protein
MNETQAKTEAVRQAIARWYEANDDCWQPEDARNIVVTQDPEDAADVFRFAVVGLVTERGWASVGAEVKLNFDPDDRDDLI